MSSTRKTTSAGAEKHPEPDRAEIEARITQIRADIGELGQMLKAAGLASLKEARHEAGDLPDQALADLHAQIHALEEQARARVTAQPLQALGLAALAGLVLGLVLRR